VLDDAAAMQLMAIDRRLSGFEQEEARRRAELDALLAARHRCAGGLTFLAPPPPTYAPAVVSPGAPTPRPETRWQSLRAGLLALGATLLVIAGIVFVTLAWPRLDQTGRAAVLVGVTAIALVLTFALRRPLPATSEAFAALFVGFALIDWYAVRQAGLGAGLEVDAWWAIGTGVVAGVAFVLGVAAGLQTTRVASAVLVQACGVLVVVVTASTPLPVSLELTTMVSLIALGALTADRARWLPAGLVLVVGAILLEAVAAAFAFATTVAELDYPLTASVMAIAVLSLPMLVVRVLSPRATGPFGHLLVAGITLCLLGAVVTAATGVRADEWMLVWSALAGTVVLLLALRSPRTIRTGAMFAALAYLAVPAMSAVMAALEAFAMPLVWFASPWRAQPFDHVTMFVTAEGEVEPRAEALAGGMGWPAVTVLAVLALGIVGLAVMARGDASRRLLPIGTAAPATIAMAAAAVILAVNVADVTLAVAVGTHVALSVALLALGVISMRRDDAPLRSFVPFGFAAVSAVPALGWAAADRWLTVAGVGAIAVAVLAAGLGSTKPPLRAALIAVGAASAFADVFFAPLAARVDAGVTGFAATIVGGLALLVGVHLVRERLVAVALRVVAAGDVVIAVTLAFSDLRWGAAALTVTVPVFLIAGWDERFELFRGVAALAALGAVWSWLMVYDVTTVEAYTLPATAVALVAGWRMARSQQKAVSWFSLGPGLVVGLIPSLIVAVPDRGGWRPVLLFIVASGVVLFGSLRRLQAPIVLGSLTATVLAVDLLWPVMARVERWVLLAIAGALFLWLGATIERRLEQVRRAQDVFGHLH
jgi:hypothetical protein